MSNSLDDFFSSPAVAKSPSAPAVNNFNKSTKQSAAQDFSFDFMTPSSKIPQSNSTPSLKQQTNKAMNSPASAVPSSKPQSGIHADFDPFGSFAAATSSSCNKANSILDSKTHSAPNTLNKTPVPTSELEKHIKAQQAASVAALRAAENKAKQEAEDKRTAANDQQLEQKLANWELNNKQKRHIRVLLSTLHQVLWPGSNWKPISIADLMDANSIKKINRKAMLIVHPDKVSWN